MILYQATLIEREEGFPPRFKSGSDKEALIRAVQNLVKADKEALMSARIEKVHVRSETQKQQALRVLRGEDIVRSREYIWVWMAATGNQPETLRRFDR